MKYVTEENVKMENTAETKETKPIEADYSSIETCYYESLHNFDKPNYPLIIQRTLQVNLNSHTSGSTKIIVRIDDHVANFEWKGSLKDLITILNPPKREVQNDECKETQ